MTKAVALTLSVIMVLQTPGLSWGATNNNDLFPNIKDNPTIGDGGNSTGGGTGGGSGGPITIDEGGGDLPFIPGTGPGVLPNPGITPIIPIDPGNGTIPGYGVGSPVSGNTMRTAEVPGQYSCPLFDNYSYQDLNLAIANLTNAIQGIADECRSTQPQIEDLRKNNEMIRESVNRLYQFMEMKNGVAAAQATGVTGTQTGPGVQPNVPIALQNGSMGFGSAVELQNGITGLVSGLDRVADAFKSTGAITKACGRKSSSWGRIALDLNNVINTASPFLLAVLALNPALSVGIKTTVLGSVVASNLISSMSGVLENNTLDMKNPDHRKAVLQNTCQYTKVARKIRYIQLAQSGRFKQLEKELKEGVKTYSIQMLGNMSADLTTMVNFRNEMQGNISSLQNSIRADKEALNELNQRIRDAQGNPLLICLEGQQLVLTSQESRAFPNTIKQSIMDAYRQRLYLKNIDLTNLSGGYNYYPYPIDSQDPEDIKQKDKIVKLITTHEKFMTVLSNFSSPPKKDEQADCAATTMALSKQIAVMINETTNIIVDDMDKFESELLENEEYRKWKAQFEKVSQESANTTRMARVLKELTNAGGAVYNRSEFNEAANALKRSLFGERRGFLPGESPVFAWLKHKYEEFTRAMGQFDKSVNTIQSKSFALTQTGRGVYGKTSFDVNRQFSKDMGLVRNLQILNKSSLPVNSPQWETACIDLEKAIKDYSEALDHLGTTNFMCDLIFDHLDNSVDSKIITYCRGVTNYAGTTPSHAYKSAIEKATDSLKKKPSANVLSPHEMSNLIAKKMTEIECRLPRAADQVD